MKRNAKRRRVRRKKPTQAVMDRFRIQLETYLKRKP